MVKKVIVTGASRGIGFELVKKFAEAGHEVIALSRNSDRLEQLKEACLQLNPQAQVHVLSFDLDKGDIAAQLMPFIESCFQHVDILINNAGLGRGFTEIFNTKAKDIDTTIDTNVNAFLQLLRCITPHMVKNKKGHIINIGSIAGLYPLSSSVYGGSKGAVHLINQNLRIELSGTGVRCTEINPGRVATEFFKVAIDDLKERKKMTTGLTVLQATDVAECIIFAIKAPAHVNISMIEVTPTEQSPGGVVIKKLKN